MRRDQEKSDVTRLRHMVDYARKAMEFTRGRNRDDLDSNEMLSLALVHLVEIIGETARNISPAFQKVHPEIPWEAITGTRNRLAHGYIEVDLDIIWQIVTTDPPPLVKKLKKVLRDFT